MKTIKLMTIGAVIAFFMSSCGGEATSPSDNNEATQESTDPVDPPVVSENTVDDSNLMENKGVGPIKSVQISEQIDENLAQEGKTAFEANCTACHKMEKKYIGPELGGVVERRSPEWIMNMILNPEVMIKEDPIAKDLLAEYFSPMANQNLEESQARAILEYFRSYNASK